MWSFILMNNIKFKNIREIHLKNVDFIFEKIFVSRLAEYDYVVIIREKKLSLKVNNILVCLFGGFSSHSQVFHSYGDLIITVEGLQMFSYTRHSWQLSSEGSLACHTYCDTGHPFIKVISYDPCHWQWSCLYLFLRHESLVAWIRTPNLQLARRMLKPTAPSLQCSQLPSIQTNLTNLNFLYQRMLRVKFDWNNNRVCGSREEYFRLW